MNKQIAWLTDGKNPAISYLASKDFLILNKTQLGKLKKNVYSWNPVKKLLKLQHTSGAFPSHAERPRQHNTYIALHWMDK